MATLGWASTTYDAAVAVCEESGERLEPRLATELGVAYESLASIWHQLNAAWTRKTAHIHREKASKQYRSAYERGESIVAMAKRVKFSPYLLARLLVEILEEVPKKAVGDLMKCPENIKDSRLRKEVVQCIEVDGHYSPKHDAARHAVGLEYEKRLEDILTNHDIPFEREDDLRRRGFPKTPDVLLSVPLGYVDQGDVHVVNWIDSKAMFGLPATYHNDHRQQLLGYVNRLGPGAVLYAFGFHNDLQHLDDDILLLSAFPDVSRLFWPDATPLATTSSRRPDPVSSVSADNVVVENNIASTTAPPQKENVPPPPDTTASLVPPPPGLRSRVVSLPPPPGKTRGQVKQQQRIPPMRVAPTQVKQQQRIQPMRGAPTQVKQQQRIQPMRVVPTQQ